MAEHKYYTCKYDRPFKEIFLNKNNENLLIKLLEKILNVKILSINLEPNERNSLNINVKRKTYDVLLNTNVGKIILDINANNKNYVHPRNVAYLCDLYSSEIKVGDSYDEKTMIMQINLSYGLNNKSKYSDENYNPIKEYYIMNNELEKFVNNFKIIEVDMDYYVDSWYNKSKKYIDDNYILVMLGLEKEELKKFSKMNMEVKKYMEKLDKVNEEPYIWQYMTQEEDEQKIRNSYKNEGIEEGIQKGIQEGIEKGKHDGIEEGKSTIIKSLINNGMSNEDVCKYVGISEEELEFYLAK